MFPLHYYLLCSVAFIWVANAATIKTSIGTVEGTEEQTVGNKTIFHAYKGVPFAEPPIGDLRFEPPTPKKPWTHIFKATKDPPACIQKDGDKIIGSEDCLYLNVYVPKNLGSNLPVMVWFFPGGFLAGYNAYTLHGPDYFLEQGVVIVTVNYRVGIFGFLSFGDLVVPGNNGLKDQVMALKWIRDNIKSFGGNPKKVTIFGQSAGSASVSYLLQSPLTKDLFQQAIMQSGVTLCSWALSRHYREVALETLKNLNIDGKDSKTALQALKKKDAKEIHSGSAAASKSILKTSTLREGYLFAPVIEPQHEGAFMSEKSYLLLEEGRFHHVPCIVGYNSMEGTVDTGFFVRAILTLSNSNPSRLVPASMHITNERENNEVGNKIKRYYFTFIPLYLASDRALTEYFSDDFFGRPTVQFVRLLSRHSKVYFYQFTYQGNLGGIKQRKIDGVAHSEELGYMWRRNEPPNEADILTRKRLITMWTNFAKEGNPTPQATKILQNTIWPLARNESNSKINIDLTYLEIGKDLKVKKNSEGQDIEFWDNLYSNYGHPPFDTY